MSIVQNIETGHNNKVKKELRNSTFSALEWAREMTLPQGEKVLLFALASRIDRDYKAMFPREVLMQDTGIKSRQSFAKHVESLVEKNLIRVGKHSHKGNQWARNSYELLVPPKYRAQKIDPQKGVKNLSNHAQNLSAYAQKMDPNCLSNYPYNYQEIDKQQDEISDPETGPESYKTFQEKSGENKTEQNNQKKPLDQSFPEVKKEGGTEFGAVFPVAARFKHQSMSGKAKICFWWECISRYRPEQYHAEKKLTGHQIKKLYELFTMYSYKPLRAVALIEHSVKNWDYISGADKRQLWHTWNNGPPKNPTPTWIVNNLDVFTDHFQEYSPIKFGPH